MGGGASLSIKHVILGFLSRSRLTGYDLKKLFADSIILPWSGNSNQIYTALVDLHKEGLVTQEVQHQEHLPARKVYAITEQGREALREWVAMSEPEPPQIRNPFLVQLAWADQLSADKLDRLLAQYEAELAVQIRMLREQQQRQLPDPTRSPRDAYLWTAISGNLIAFYTHELEWARELRQGLASYPTQDT